MGVQSRNFFPLAAVLSLAIGPVPGAGQTLPRFGVAAGASTLGAEIQAATALSENSNVRVGFNYFNYSRDFRDDGISFNGTLGLRSAEVLYDRYLVGGLHVSPGLMFVGENQVTATASVGPGQSFKLGGTTFYSDLNTPVVGTGAVSLTKTAPMVLLGVGNLLPRSERHVTVNFEVGVVFQASPTVGLHLAGTACTARGKGCQSIDTTSPIQANILSEQTKIGSDLSFFKYYPVVSLTFGYRF